MPKNHGPQMMLYGGASLILALGACSTQAQETQQAPARTVITQTNPPVIERHEVRIERKVVDGEEQVELWINGKKIEVANMADVRKALAEAGESLELQIVDEPGGPQAHHMMLHLAPSEGDEDQGDEVHEFQLGDGMELDLSNLDASAFTFSQPKAMLGVSLAPISDDLRDYLGLAEGAGVRVNAVVDDSPAAKAGLKERDIIVAATIGSESHDSISADDLRHAISQAEPDTKVILTILRKGEKQQITATLAKWDAQSLGMGMNLGSGGPFELVSPEFFGGRELQVEGLPRLRQKMLEVTPQLREMKRALKESLPDHDAMLKMMEQQLEQIQQMLDQLRRQQEQLRQQAEEPHTPEA